MLVSGSYYGDDDEIEILYEIGYVKDYDPNSESYYIVWANGNGDEGWNDAEQVGIWKEYLEMVLNK